MNTLLWKSVKVSLEEQRLQAAEASGGASSDVIYDRILQIIGELDLHGSALRRARRLSGGESAKGQARPSQATKLRVACPLKLVAGRKRRE